MNSEPSLERIQRLLHLLRELKRLAPETSRTAYPIDALFPAEGPLRRDLYPKHLEFFRLGTQVVERAFIAGNRVGKALRHGTGVLTPKGFVPIEDLRVGDTVIGGDGQPCNVVGVFPQGLRQVAGVRFDDGVETFCDMDHLWKCRTVKSGWGVRRTADMRASCGAPARRLRIPAPGACYLEQRDVPVDPYIMGVMLGDGTLRESQPVLTTVDTELVDAIAARYSVRRCGDSIQYAVGSGLVTDLKMAGAYGKLAHDKEVPTDYLVNGRPQRLALLQGLMDTDGTVSADGRTTEFNSTSPHLTDAVAYLARSLGGKVKISWRRTSFYQNGVKLLGRPSSRVRMQLPVCPFRLTRKRKRWRQPAKTLDRIVYEISSAGEAECTCIAVDSLDHTFVIDGFVVTHNTIVGGYETCLHLTGIYPEWWPGFRFHHPVDWWACGDTSQTTRDIVQQSLIGPIGREHEGLGLLRSDTIIDMRRKSHGVRDAYETIYVRHSSGGTSTLGLKSYDQRRIAFQGTKKHGIWDDEEPPLDVYSEQMLRITDTSGGGEPGMMLGTFTPLMGMTDVVMRFLEPEDIAA